jgi:acetyl-CoA carboxylase biotin carboxyl carrier protein
MDLEKIQKLIQLVNEAQLAELKLVEGDSSVCITRGVPITASPAPMHTLSPSSAFPIHTADKTTAPPLQEGHTIRSPMVGTAYLAPNPDAKPFVEIGQTIKEGDTLCIIEAMKMMNYITSDRTGTIKARLIEDALPVEYDQPLFVIE